jgi:hypothetical protein
VNRKTFDLIVLTVILLHPLGGVAEDGFQEMERRI